MVNNPWKLKKQTAGWTIPFRKYHLFFLFHGQQTKHLLVIGCRALQTHRSGHHCVIEKTVPKRQEQCATNTTRNDRTLERIALNYHHGTHQVLHFQQPTQKWTNVERHDANKLVFFLFFLQRPSNICARKTNKCFDEKEEKIFGAVSGTQHTLYHGPKLCCLERCYHASWRLAVALRCDLGTNAVLLLKGKGYGIQYGLKCNRYSRVIVHTNFRETAWFTGTCWHFLSIEPVGKHSRQIFEAWNLGNSSKLRSMSA